MPADSAVPRRRRRAAAAALENVAAKSFFRVVATDEARAAIALTQAVGSEAVATANARDRVLAADLAAPEDMPHFDRANMDGYAVRARDTFGASASVPAYLELIGVVEMGQQAKQMLGRGQAVRISTGGMLPPGADAVVMVEYTEEFAGNVAQTGASGHTVEIQRSAAPWEHVLRTGEDIARGDVVFARGRRLRGRDLGALAGIGITKAKVHKRPRVALLSTGDEIVAAHTKPRPGQVRDINAASLVAMIAECGAVAVDQGLVADRRDALEAALARALQGCDAVVLSGGSSVGVKDITLEVIQGFARSQITFHGISVAPGKPTILAQALGKPVLGLPGHPQSALVIFELFGAPLLRILGGECPADAFRPQRTVRARLGRNVASKTGREDYVRVRIETVGTALRAMPMAGKSGAIFNLVKADGLVCIPASVEGLDEEADVEVILL